MLLTGSFQRSLDDKCRFAIPKPVRDAMPDEAGNGVVYMAPGTDQSLVIYSEQAFSRLSAQLEQGPPTAREVRAFSRLFYAQAQRVEMDRQGRVRIPTGLVELAGLQKEIVLLGVRDHLEIWDRQRWESYLNQNQPCYDEIAEGAFGAPPRESGNARESTPRVNTEEQSQPNHPR